MLSKAYLDIIDFLFPPRCILCGVHIQRSGYLCSDCFKQLEFIVEPCCEQCGTPFLSDSEAGEDHLCLSCREEPCLWEKGRAAFVYNEGIKKLILPLKYADRLNGLNFLAGSIWNIANPFFDNAAYIIPVPLYKKRLRHRKYNQSALLGKKLAKRSNIPLLLLALKRIRDTQSLGHLNKQERQDLLENAFQVNLAYLKILQGKTIILVDDVMTTGSTLMACSRILLEAGVKRIFVVVIAKVSYF